MFFDGQQAQLRRRDLAYAAAVAAGRMSAAEAWPEFFAEPEAEGIPSTAADMSDFTWEQATPESYEQDMAAVLAAAGNSVRIPDGPDPAPPQPPPPRTPAQLEWS